MKLLKMLLAVLAMGLLLAACGEKQAEKEPVLGTIVNISFSDEEILADGVAVTENTGDAVYVARDIIYYQAGQAIGYGDGGEENAHTAEEANAHQVVHITKPGTYRLSGTLSKGQVAVDLGKDAKEDPTAVVTLILDGVDITCQVAPAVIFYNVYECGDEDNPTKDVDTSAAGANVMIADGKENNINGSYVAKIYKPESVKLSEDGTQVEEAKKLHKYDGAFYSKMSMNVFGEKKGTGVLNIRAANEGLDSEMHLTLNGGNINIFSGNDGINTNEDGISVTTVNGGSLTVTVTGETGEGDGIDSNGWLVINGGTVIASACAHSADAGIDSDMGIHINGGTVIAGGSMLDRIEAGGQTYAVFSLMQRGNGETPLSLKKEDGTVVAEISLPNAFSTLIYSSPDLEGGAYTLWNGDTQIAQQSSGMMGGPGGMGPGGMGGPQQPEGGQFPGQRPEGGMTPPDGFTPPEGGQFPQFPGESDGRFPEGGQFPFPEGGQPPEKPENGAEYPQFDKQKAPSTDGAFLIAFV